MENVIIIFGGTFGNVNSCKSRYPLSISVSRIIHESQICHHTTFKGRLKPHSSILKYYESSNIYHFNSFIYVISVIWALLIFKWWLKDHFKTENKSKNCLASLTEVSIWFWGKDFAKRAAKFERKSNFQHDRTLQVSILLMLTK